MKGRGFEADKKAIEELVERQSTHGTAVVRTAAAYAAKLLKDLDGSTRPPCIHLEGEEYGASVREILALVGLYDGSEVGSSGGVFGDFLDKLADDRREELALHHDGRAITVAQVLRVVIARLLTLNSVKATAQEEESEGEAETNVAGHEEAKLEACSPRQPNADRGAEPLGGLPGGAAGPEDGQLMSFASWVSSADLGAEADEQLMSLASWEPSADRGAEPLGGLPGGAAGPGIAGDEDGWGPKKPSREASPVGDSEVLTGTRSVATPDARSNLGGDNLNSVVQNFLGVTSAIDVDSGQLRDDLNTLRQELEGLKKVCATGTSNTILGVLIGRDPDCNIVQDVIAEYSRRVRLILADGMPKYIVEHDVDPDELWGTWGNWSPSCAEGPGAADDEEENVFTRMLRSIFIAEVISGLNGDLRSLGMKDPDYYLSPSALATFLPPADYSDRYMWFCCKNISCFASVKDRLDDMRQSSVSGAQEWAERVVGFCVRYYEKTTTSSLFGVFANFPFVLEACLGGINEADFPPLDVLEEALQDPLAAGGHASFFALLVEEPDASDRYQLLGNADALRKSVMNRIDAVATEEGIGRLRIGSGGAIRVFTKDVVDIFLYALQQPRSSWSHYFISLLNAAIVFCERPQNELEPLIEGAFVKNVPPLLIAHLQTKCDIGPHSASTLKMALNARLASDLGGAQGDGVRSIFEQLLGGDMHSANPVLFLDYEFRSCFKSFITRSPEIFMANREGLNDEGLYGLFCTLRFLFFGNRAFRFCSAYN